MQNELQSCLPKIITTGFKSIQLIYFFTAGEDEVKCWQIRKGSKAPQVGESWRETPAAWKLVKQPFQSGCYHQTLLPPCPLICRTFQHEGR